MFIKSIRSATVFTVKNDNSKILSLCRFCGILKNSRYLHQESGIWDEDLSQETKLKIEDYWKNKLQYSEFDSSREDSKFYVLSMFPYPSGNLHMGHIRVYSISDALARFYRMKGKNVLHPMGWDAFGLPAENAAIERGLSSEKWTANNINTMREQLKQLCCTFDWSREISTCHKDYYKFTQMIFLKMYEQGLVYQKKALVNWDPVDQTVLADEQVDEEGCSWRSGAKVEKRVLKQWFVRTTFFAKALYDGLNRKDLEDWKDIIELQKNWIGVCDGVSFEFPVKEKEEKVTLWTDRAEHLSKAKFVAVTRGSVYDLENEGTGNRKLNLHLINIITGELLPIYVTDELPFHKGADARIGIPELFQCDLDFAKRVNLPLNNLSNEPIQDNISARQDVINKLNGRITSSQIKDWLISRQRHWGTPIPVVHCAKCGVQPVAYEQLPVELPTLEKVSKKGSSLGCSEKWISTSCPKCGGPASRDLDTMDTFVDSSWYYLRYVDPHNHQEPFSKNVAAKLMPVDIYVGGKEHAVLHLYYARFMSYFLHSLGWLQDPEPFKRLLVQGLIMGKTYKVMDTSKYIPATQVDFTGDNPVDKESGQEVVISWDKMSKSKHNGVDPGEVFREYGIDTTRLLILANVSPTSQRNWDDTLFLGVLNWQRKMWLTVQEFRRAKLRADSLSSPIDLPEANVSLRDTRNYHLKGISVSYQIVHHLNRVIAKMQSLTTSLRHYGEEYKAHSVEFERALAMQIVTLSPMAPHFAAQLWMGLQELPGLQTIKEFDWSKPVHQQKWPSVDKDYKLGLVCMVNSATKDTIKLSREELDKLTVSSATQLALTSPQVRLYTDQTPIEDAKLKLYPGIQASIQLCLDHTKLNFEKDHYTKKKNKQKKKSVKQ